MPEGTDICVNCDMPIYMRAYGTPRWFHADTMAADCDHPVDKAEPKPEPEPVTEERFEQVVTRINRNAVNITTIEQRLESLELDVERVKAFEKANKPRYIVAVDPAQGPMSRPMFRHFCSTHNRDFEICMWDVEVSDQECIVGGTRQGSPGPGPLFDSKDGE